MKFKTATIQGHKLTLELEAEPYEIAEEIKGNTEVYFRQTSEQSTFKQKAFLWAKINLLADILRVSKRELYEHLLKEYGQGEYIETELSIGELRKIYRVIEVLRKDDKLYCLVYRGIERLDRREIAVLTDGVLWELKQIE